MALQKLGTPWQCVFVLTYRLHVGHYPVSTVDVQTGVGGGGGTVNPDVLPHHREPRLRLGTHSGTCVERLQGI